MNNKSLFFESSPTNPSEVILKNEFYHIGLTHGDIHSYYITNKSKILEETKNRDLMIFFATSLNHIIVKRKTSLGFYRLDSSNYDDIISGRTISIHSTMNQFENFGIIDIDGPNWDDNKLAAKRVYDWAKRQSYFKNAKIVYTGKTSFHIYIYFKQRKNIDDIRNDLKSHIMSQNEFNYPISNIRNNKIPNLDLSSNKFRGGFITLGSLSVFGLKCMEVNSNDLDNFKKEDAKIISSSRNINECVDFAITQLIQEEFERYSKRMQHCYDDLDYFLKITKGHNIYWSPKLDGVRCWIIINKRTIPHAGSFKKIADIKYISRNDNNFINLQHFNNDMIDLCHTLNREKGIRYPIIFDCEITSPNKNLSEVLTQLRRKNVGEKNFFSLNIFDLAINLPFESRQKLLEHAFLNNHNNQIIFLKANVLKSISDIEKLKNDAIKQGYEGIMLNDGEATYHFGKRTRYCCKQKEFHTIELKILDVIPGEVGTKYEGMMSKFLCSYNGQTIYISGRLDIKTRIELLKNPPVGQYIEVRYKEITNDGKLRDPVFVRFRPDLGDQHGYH